MHPENIRYRGTDHGTRDKNFGDVKTKHLH